MSIATVTPLRPPAGDRRVARSLHLVPPIRARRPLRLTRRGRSVVTLMAGLAIFLAVGATVLGLQRAAAAGASGGRVPVEYHVVLPGETLWGIAAAEVPGTEVRAAVARLIELNALPNGRVFVGQRLAVEKS
jgi:LysM domain